MTTQAATMIAMAQLKQEDVFKSISDNVGNSSDPKVFYVVAAIGVAIVLLLVFVNKMMKRRATPQAMNHQGKLVGELLKKVPLRKKEVKHLRTMAAEQGCDSPLTLVLCPSLMAKALSEKGRADKRVVMGVARKMGIVKKK
jgi:hypothetical protein